MLKQKLTILGNVENIISVSQNLVNNFSIDKEDKGIFISLLSLFASKFKSYMTYSYVKKHIDNEFIKFDIVRMSKYSLPVTFNLQTKKVLVNISALGKRSVSNIDPKDLYALILYGHTFANLILNSVPKQLSTYCVDYMSSLFLKVFAKKYGLTGSYFELIPELRYIISLYILVSFFDMSQNKAYIEAVKTSRYNYKKSEIEFDKYDFSKISDFIKCLDKSGTLPGINAYIFINTMSNRYDTINLPMFEDFYRFASILITSTVSQNSIVPTKLRFINDDLFDKITKSLLRLL